MVNIDYYAANGFALELLAQSDYHKQFALGDFFRTEILPALWCGQVRFWIADNGLPTAMITWAWLPKSARDEIHLTGRSIARDEWQGGEHPFINDCVAPYGNMRSVASEIATVLFPDHIVSSLRRNPDGSIRRINRWTGVNLRKSSKEAAA